MWHGFEDGDIVVQCPEWTSESSQNTLRPSDAASHRTRRNLSEFSDDENDTSSLATLQLIEDSHFGHSSRYPEGVVMPYDPGSGGTSEPGNISTCANG